MTDQELSRLFSRLPDRDAFSGIYEALKQPVYTVCLRIVQSRELAEDICQDVFVKLYQSPPAPSVLRVRAWVFRMARNLSIDALRKKENQHHDTPEDAEAAYLPDWDTWLDLEAALNTLPQSEREILTLHINASLSFTQIAGITGASLSSVYRTYRRALKTLRNYLNGGIK